MIKISNRFISTTKPFPTIQKAEKFYQRKEQVDWRDQIDVFYKSMYAPYSSSVATFNVALYWS